MKLLPYEALLKLRTGLLLAIDEYDDDASDEVKMRQQRTMEIVNSLALTTIAIELVKVGNTLKQIERATDSL